MKYLLFFLGLLTSLLFYSSIATNAKAEICSANVCNSPCQIKCANDPTKLMTITREPQGENPCEVTSYDYSGCNPAPAVPTPTPTPTPIVKTETTCYNEGDRCDYSINGRRCQGVCLSSLECSQRSDHDYCYPEGAPTPTPTPIIIKAGAQPLIFGVQLPNAEAINRLVPSQYSFGWVKFQHQLGTSPEALKTLIQSASSADAGGGKKYGVLISIAKNSAGIETLKNPGTDYPVHQKPEVYSDQICPFDSELETVDFPYGCGTARRPQTCHEYIKAKVYPNGYGTFMNRLKDLAPFLSGADAAEVWNEPNLAVEWKDQGLGNVNPENYVNFLNCGIKGLRAGGYNNKTISAALAPLAPNDGNNMNDLDFFSRFVAAGGLNQVDAVGWHSNVTSDIQPSNTGPNGFQRFRQIFSKIGNKKIWLTEFGWNRNTFNLEDFAARQQQALYISQAYDLTHTLAIRSHVDAMFVWNFGFTKAGQTGSDFVPWDIEGTPPTGTLCQPNAEITKYRKDRGSTKYVQDTSLTDDVLVATVAGQALIPKVVIEDASRSAAAGIQANPETRVDSRKSFLDNIPGLVSAFNFLDSILAQLGIRLKFCGFLGLSEDFFCKPNLSIGFVEKTDNNKLVPGKNTPTFASQAKILGQTAIPAGMELTPEIKDCNIGQLGEATDSGNIDLNEISETMGTTTGFYGNGMPNFKTLTPDDWEALIQDQMQKDNLNIGSKLFSQDKRSPDMYLRKAVFCKGNYPNGICPFEPSPTSTPK